MKRSYLIFIGIRILFFPYLLSAMERVKSKEMVIKDLSPSTDTSSTSSLEEASPPKIITENSLRKSSTPTTYEIFNLTDESSFENNISRTGQELLMYLKLIN